jgi:hypothetical protein
VGRPQLGEQRDEGRRGERVGRSRKALFSGVCVEGAYYERGRGCGALIDDRLS